MWVESCDSYAENACSFFLPDGLSLLRMLSWIIGNWNKFEVNLLVETDSRRDVAETGLYSIFLLFLLELCNFFDNRHDPIIYLLSADENDTSLTVEVADHLLEDIFLHGVDVVDPAEEGYWLPTHWEIEVFVLIDQRKAVEAIFGDYRPLLQFLYQFGLLLFLLWPFAGQFYLIVHLLEDCYAALQIIGPEIFKRLNYHGHTLLFVFMNQQAPLLPLRLISGLLALPHIVLEFRISGMHLDLCLIQQRHSFACGSLILFPESIEGDLQLVDFGVCNFGVEDVHEQ